MVRGAWNGERCTGSGAQEDTVLFDAVFIRNSITDNFEYVFRLKEINRRGGGVADEQPEQAGKSL